MKGDSRWDADHIRGGLERGREYHGIFMECFGMRELGLH